MRALLLVGWLMVPVGVGIWHYGPGQERMLLDDAAGALAEADGFAAAGKWDAAAEKYGEALRLLPASRTEETRRVRLARAKAQMLAKQLPEARADLQALVEALEGDPSANPELLADARSSLASAQYYMTWLMRLEGQPRELWEKEIESARQIYRLLAEAAEDLGDGETARKNREDLESAIRLARMDLSELQALPLPSQ
jgi:hypothetical protein